MSYNAAKSPTGDGEAVGAVLQHERAARARPFAFAESPFRLFGQYFHGTMAAPMHDLVARI